MKTILFLSLLLVTGSAFAHDMESMTAAKEDGDQHRNEWFKSLSSEGGGRCCDGEDGHHLAEKFTKNVQGRWYVDLDGTGEWTLVPPDRIVKKPSMDGEAYVFRYENRAFGVRCFVPPVPTY